METLYLRLLSPIFRGNQVKILVRLQFTMHSVLVTNYHHDGNLLNWVYMFCHQVSLAFPLLQNCKTFWKMNLCHNSLTSNVRL